MIDFFEKRSMGISSLLSLNLFFRGLGLDKVWEKSYKYRIDKVEVLAKKKMGRGVVGGIPLL